MHMIHKVVIKNQNDPLDNLISTKKNKKKKVYNLLNNIRKLMSMNEMRQTTKL